MALQPKRPPFGVALETSLLGNMAFEPNTPRDGVLDASLFGDTPLEPEKILAVDEGLLDPDQVLIGGGWANMLLAEGTGFEVNGLTPRDSVFF